MQEYFLVFSAELHFVTGTDFAAYEFSSWVPIIFCLGACLLVFCSHTIYHVQLFGFAFFIFNYLAKRCTPPPPKKKQLSKQTPSCLTQICETKMQASGQQISMLNFCKLVMECYVGPSVTRCHQKLTRTCTCCIFVMMYPVWLYVVPAVSYLFGLEVRNLEPAKKCICENMCVLIYLTVNIPPWPSMTVITSCCFLLCMCECVCVCSTVCCVVPSFEHHSGPLG